MSIKVSLRNSIIEDYRNGIINPDYEVVKTKTKGRYTVRKRKVPLTEEEINELQNNNTTEQQTRGYNSIERSESETAYRSLAEPMPPTSLTMPKVSKKENALFDLQNQLNAQLLYRINELTDKVSKLKTFKKKVKKDFYENDDNNEDTEHESAMESSQRLFERSESEAVEQPTTIPQSGYEYMANIPNDADKEVAEQPGQPEPQYNTYQPVKNYKRNKIDYAKFGF